MIHWLVVIGSVVWWLLIQLVPGLAPAPVVLPDGACSENPAYAEALVALDWLADHPPPIVYYAMYGHAELDALYAQLVAGGDVPPVPPACLLGGRISVLLRDRPDPVSQQTGILGAGQTAAIYGRSADGAWWYVRTDARWGWVDGRVVTVQPATDVSGVPVH